MIFIPKTQVLLNPRLSSFSLSLYDDLHQDQLIRKLVLHLNLFSFQVK